MTEICHFLSPSGRNYRTIRSSAQGRLRVGSFRRTIRTYKDQQHRIPPIMMAFITIINQSNHLIVIMVREEKKVEWKKNSAVFGVSALGQWKLFD